MVPVNKISVLGGSDHLEVVLEARLKDEEQAIYHMKNAK